MTELRSLVCRWAMARLHVDRLLGVKNEGDTEFRAHLERTTGDAELELEHCETLLMKTIGVTRKWEHN